MHWALRRYRTYLGTFLLVSLHLHALAKVHQRLVDLARLSESGTSSLRIARTLRPSKIHDAQLAARPRSLVLSVTLLDLHAEEAVTAGADSIAASASNLALHQTSLKDHHSFFEATADDLRQACHHFAIWTLFCALE